jgi:hypothetical protein
VPRGNAETSPINKKDTKSPTKVFASCNQQNQGSAPASMVADADAEARGGRSARRTLARLFEPMKKPSQDEILSNMAHRPVIIPIPHRPQSARCRRGRRPDLPAARCKPSSRPLSSLLLYITPFALYRNLHLAAVGHTDLRGTRLTRGTSSTSTVRNSSPTMYTLRSRIQGFPNPLLLSEWRAESRRTHRLGNGGTRGRGQLPESRLMSTAAQLPVHVHYLRYIRLFPRIIIIEYVSSVRILLRLQGADIKSRCARD